MMHRHKKNTGCKLIYFNNKTSATSIFVNKKIDPTLDILSMAKVAHLFIDKKKVERDFRYFFLL